MDPCARHSKPGISFIFFMNKFRLLSKKKIMITKNPKKQSYEIIFILIYNKMSLKKICLFYMCSLNCHNSPSNPCKDPHGAQKSFSTPSQINPLSTSNKHLCCVFMGLYMGNVTLTNRFYSSILMLLSSYSPSLFWSS